MVLSPKPTAADSLRAALEIPVYFHTIPRLEAELRRARRYERPLSMIVIGAEGVPRGGRLRASTDAFVPGPAEMGPLLFAFLGAFLRSSLRETDLLAAVPESLLYVGFLPEVDGDGAEEAASRVAAEFAVLTSLKLRTGIAEFPRDGFTVGDLFQSATQDALDRAAPRRSAGTLTQDASHA